LQRVFSSIPGGENLNYFFQRYVTRSLPAGEAEFSATVSYARRHIDIVKRYFRRSLDEATFYEFGVGWDMTIPLAFYAFGVERQILVDIRNLIRPHLVKDTIEKYHKLGSDLAILRQPANCLNGTPRDLTALLKKHYGIDYRAPCDARQTGLKPRSVDCITSTSTLEHIPPEDIQSILRECHRILRDDGLMSVLIDYDDHYSYFDTKVSGYNFLQYSDRMWPMFNPALHYQNRLRHRDYLEFFQSAGFDVVEDQHKEVTETDEKTLDQLSLDARFRNYSSGDLAVHNALLVLRKRLDRRHCYFTGSRS
jgi:predicted SAM-dependent methyltransferase